MSRDFQRFPVPALSAIANAVGDDPCAALYLSRLPEQVIICPMGTVERGFHVEQEPLAVLPYACSTEMLGQAVWESLLQFKATPGLNLRASKKTDWPAYRVSGAKSIRQFEEEYLRVSVVAFPGVLRVQAAVPDPDADGLFVGHIIASACEFEALGELIRVVFRCSNRLAEQRLWKA